MSKINKHSRKILYRSARSRSGVFLAALLAGVALLGMSPTAQAAGGQLIGQWKFDETVAGSTAIDSIGTNHAVPFNDPVPSTDVAPVSFANPRSASFDGSNYFTIDRPVSTDFTICAWVKTTSTGGGTDHWTSAPIMDSETSGVDYDFGFGVGNGGRLMFGNGGDDVVNGNLFDAQVNGTTPINDNVWHNVCVTRDNATGEVRLYVDANLDGSGITGIGALTSNPFASIGYGYDGAALFDGKIDDVRAYDTALTPQQLGILASGGSNPLAVSRTVSFDAQGGSAVAGISDYAGTVATLPTAAQRSGYTFLHWNTAADGSGTSYVAGASYTITNADVTLYAIYSPVAAATGSTPAASITAPDTGVKTGSIATTLIVGTLGIVLLFAAFIVHRGGAKKHASK